MHRSTLYTCLYCPRAVTLIVYPLQGSAGGRFQVPQFAAGGEGGGDNTADIGVITRRTGSKPGSRFRVLEAGRIYIWVPGSVCSAQTLVWEIWYSGRTAF